MADLEPSSESTHFPPADGERGAAAACPAPASWGRIGLYELIVEIGRGGMGAVYQAWHPVKREFVALKVVRPDRFTSGESFDRARELFLREGRILMSVAHPNVVRCVDTNEGLHGGVPVLYMALELLRGGTLAERLRRGPLPLHEAIRVATAAAHALAALHGHEPRILHRDVTPANIYLTDDGGVKLLDFGLSGVADWRDTELSRFAAGSRPYMSPEQFDGLARCTERSDLYSLGVVLFRAAAGRCPFEEETDQGFLEAHRHRSPPPLVQANPGLAGEPLLEAVENIVTRLLAKRPEERFATASDVAAALERAAAGGRIEPARVTRPEATRRRRRIAAGIAAAAAVFAIAAGARFSFIETAAALRTPRALAVLPLEEPSGDARQPYYADGMTASLTEELARVSPVRVISQSSAERFKGSALPVSEIAVELGVDAVVKGVLSRAEGRIRIAVELIDGETGRRRWRESYDRHVNEAPLLPAEIAQAIAHDVGARKDAATGGSADRERRVSPEAHEAYLRGRYHLLRYSQPEWRTAIGLFERAVALDEGYAYGHVGLAEAYMVAARYDFFSPREVCPRAKQEARRAIEIDERISAAHRVLGLAHTFYDWDFDAAEREFRRAIALDPSDAEAHHWYSHLLLNLGRFEESWVETQRAVATAPGEIHIATHVGHHWFFARDYGRAIEGYRAAIAMDPGHPPVHLFLGQAYMTTGLLDQALAELEASTRFTVSTRARAYTARVHALAGRRADAEAVLRDLEAGAGGKYVSSVEIAAILVCLGETARALEWLERGFEERSSSMAYLKVDPVWDPIREDPRFRALLARVGLTP